MAVKEMSMKHIRLILVAVSLMMAAGCKKDTDKGLDLIGTWELVDIVTKSVQIGEETVKVTLTFYADNTFSLSQQLGAGRPAPYSGIWQLTGTTLTGKYSDGKAWGSGYDISCAEDRLMMTPDVEGAETYIYDRVR